MNLYTSTRTRISVNTPLSLVLYRSSRAECLGIVTAGFLTYVYQCQSTKLLSFFTNIVLYFMTIISVDINCEKEFRHRFGKFAQLDRLWSSLLNLIDFSQAKLEQ